MTLNSNTSANSTNSSLLLSQDLEIDETEKIREQILIVDDEEIVRSFISDHLSTDYECFEASSVNEALEILAEEKISLVLTDWKMPGSSGFTLLHHIKEHFSDTSVIMVSGVNSPERVLDVMRSGAFDYLLKPCDPDILELTVERALKYRDLEIKNRQYNIDLELQNFEFAKQNGEMTKLQEKMIQAEKMASFGQLSAEIAHELKNPLSCVSGNLQLLDVYLQDIYKLIEFYETSKISEIFLSDVKTLKNTIRFEDAIEDIRKIVADCADGTRRISELVENLRVFSKIGETMFTETNINCSLNSTVELLREIFDERKIKLTKNYGDVPLINACAENLKQVWKNLLLNAARSLEKKDGEIVITTKAEGDFVFIKIADTGEGIASENINRVFDRFFTTKFIGQKTELGLSIAHSIIEQHSGSITAENKLDKKGKILTIKLPIASQC